MSRKSTLTSQSSMKLDQEMRECRIAYLSVLSSTSENMTSSKELTLALQYSGRNPTQKSVKKYWKHSTESLSYSEFCEIMKQEKQNSKSDLVSAFKKMDLNNDGFISFSELKKALTMYGEKMSESEVQDILDEADDDGDGRLDYEEFCDMMMSTAEKCKELSQKKVKDNVASREQKSSSFTRKSNNVNSVQSKPPKSQRTAGKAVKEPKNLKEWNLQTRKGFIVVEDDGIFSSHCYKLKVPSTTKLWLTIHGSIQGRQTDFTLFVLKADSGELVAFTQAIVDERSCVLADISAGEYNVLVFTTGCQLSARSFESKRTVELIKTANGEIELTKRCRDALTEIFHHCDLDGNGYMNRQEFDVFQMRTSGESCDDDAWDVMVENFDIRNGREITLKGFLDLNLMEARDAEGDPNDLWVTFNSMGYNKGLEPDQVAFFVADVYSRDCDIKLQALKIDDNSEILHKAVIQSIVENSTTRNVKRMRDLILHRYEDDKRVSLVVENKSRQAVMVRLNCNKSQNCVSHCGNLNYVIKVEARSIEVGHHLIAMDPSKPWSVSCDDSVEE